MFFPSQPTIPAPPDRFVECGMEWRIGYGIGWKAGPAIPPDYSGAPKIGRFSPMSSLRRSAFAEGVNAGRDAKRALVAENIDRITGEGTAHSAVWHNYPRKGWLWSDAFFFGYGTSALPACVPVSDLSPVHSVSS